ncbi:hypothetical protein EI94DRAFT_561201 [Lactarius quietus]|nr:hypothetical protein EI94DRAFT_561201 [Lactarius quietus]
MVSASVIITVLVMLSADVYRWSSVSLMYSERLMGCWLRRACSQDLILQSYNTFPGSRYNPNLDPTCLERSVSHFQLLLWPGELLLWLGTR